MIICLRTSARFVTSVSSRILAQKKEVSCTKESFVDFWVGFPFVWFFLQKMSGTCVERWMSAVMLGAMYMESFFDHPSLKNSFGDICLKISKSMIVNLKTNKQGKSSVVHSKKIVREGEGEGGSHLASDLKRVDGENREGSQGFWQHGAWGFIVLFQCRKELV